MSSTASWPSMALAATLPPLRALDQCSLRWCSPVKGCRALATSPAAKIPGAEVRSEASVRMPFCRAMPAASASDTSGTTPTAMITRSAGRTSPASVTTPVTRPDCALIPGGRGGEPEPDAVRLVQRAEEPAQLRPDRRAQRHLLQPQQGDGVSIGARRRGELHPDPARTDHHDVPAAVGQAGAQAAAVVHGAEGADPLQRRFRAAECAGDVRRWPAAGRRSPDSGRPGGSRCGRPDQSPRRWRPAAGRLRSPRTSRPEPRAGRRLRPCPAGIPWTAAGAGRDGAAPPPAGSPARRILPRGGSWRRWRRRVRRPRSRCFRRP